MQNTLKKAIKESLNGYLPPFQSDKLAERIAKRLIDKGVVIPAEEEER